MKYAVGPSTKRTGQLVRPTKQDGSIDCRYKTAQFVKSDGSRDMRTTLTSNR